MTSLPIDNEVHELKLGNSFNPQSKIGFHTIRYDFKPASVDTNKEACVEVVQGNQVKVTVPHVEGSGSTHTVFKGNKQPLMKECVLIIDHKTGTYTLEKLTSKVTVKKTRLEGSSKAMQHITGRTTPVEKKPAKASSSSSTSSSSKPSSKQEASNTPDTDSYSITPIHSGSSKGADDIGLVGEITDSSSDEEEEPRPPPSFKSAPKPGPSSREIKKFDVLDNDLALSSSGSDSD
ncbi:Ell-associated factor 1 [Plakobranchus ocellatus]|uniref:Ell-associated factor 1 n=1 Tax=Plakobranchus ocellatus TaxID=259542 RepID=A0AAV3ZBF4_9GAST|nr:Ell-associated factor 1 [Plakobranchus ocellatus]